MTQKVGWDPGVPETRGIGLPENPGSAPRSSGMTQKVGPAPG